MDGWSLVGGDCSSLFHVFITHWTCGELRSFGPKLHLNHLSYMYVLQLYQLGVWVNLLTSQFSLIQQAHPPDCSTACPVSTVRAPCLVRDLLSTTASKVSSSQPITGSAFQISSFRCCSLSSSPLCTQPPRWSCGSVWCWWRCPGTSTPPHEHSAPLRKHVMLVDA